PATASFRPNSRNGWARAARSWCGRRLRRQQRPPGSDRPRIDPREPAPHTCRMARKTTSDASPVADFEASLDALEQLVEKMEHGDMSLEESLAAYERGVGLYRRCQG